MTTGTLAGALEEAEMIVSAEWVRIQCELIESEMPAARSRGERVALLTMTADRPGTPPPGCNRRQPTRRRPGRVWPTQRSPPHTGPIAVRSGSFRKEVMP